MNESILFERDILYPTENSSNPGSIHLQVFAPNENAKIPIVIESRSGHSPLDYMDSIIKIVQSDIFDRIFINVKKDVEIFVKMTSELEAEYGKHSHIKLSYAGEKIEKAPVNW